MYLPIQVTSSTIPTDVQKNQILFVLPFAGVPTPTNRLPVGMYFSTLNPVQRLRQGNATYVWQNVMTLLTASIEALITVTINSKQGQFTETTNFIKGTNTVTHNLNKIPRFVRYYINGSPVQFNENLNSGNPLKNFTVYSDKAYNNVTINIIAF